MEISAVGWAYGVYSFGGVPARLPPLPAHQTRRPPALQADRLTRRLKPWLTLSFPSSAPVGRRDTRKLGGFVRPNRTALVAILDRQLAGHTIWNLADPRWPAITSPSSTPSPRPLGRLISLDGQPHRDAHRRAQALQGRYYRGPRKRSLSAPAGGDTAPLTSPHQVGRALPLGPAGRASSEGLHSRDEPTARTGGTLRARPGDSLRGPTGRSAT